MRERFGVDELRASLVTYRDLLRDHRAAIDGLNVFPVADRDTGTNMARTLEVVVAALADVPSVATYDAVTQAALRGARGNSGVILSQVLRGLCETLGAAPSADASTLARALGAASAGADQAVLDPVEGTILTVARQSAAAAVGGVSITAVLRSARDAGRAALEATPSQLPVLAAAGVVDAGAAGFVLLLDAMVHVVAGDPLPQRLPAVSVRRPAGRLAVLAESVRRPAGRLAALAESVRRPAGRLAALAESVLPAARRSAVDARYEVMFVCELDEEGVESLQKRWGELGDSITIAGGDGEWACHVHTNDIGGVIEAALDVGGRPRQIRVADLSG